MLLIRNSQPPIYPIILFTWFISCTSSKKTQVKVDMILSVFSRSICEGLDMDWNSNEWWGKDIGLSFPQHIFSMDTAFGWNWFLTKTCYLQQNHSYLLPCPNNFSLNASLKMCSSIFDSLNCVPSNETFGKPCYKARTLEKDAKWKQRKMRQVSPCAYPFPRIHVTNGWVPWNQNSSSLAIGNSKGAEIATLFIGLKRPTTVTRLRSNDGKC